MTAATLENSQWFYMRRPEGRVGAEHYELRKMPLDPAVAANEVYAANVSSVMVKLAD